MQLSEYSLESLRDDGEFILYRGHAKPKGSPSVLLLTAASNRPSPESLKKIDHEYSLRNELDSAWAVRPLAISERSAQVTLVLEDPGGETLDGFLSGAMEIPQFLRLAVGLARALRGLHESELIHKDVKPSNVLINPATGQVRLIGFGIASRLRREHQPPEPPEFIAGTLPYMAPEQTGRMNRSIDSRSDLYALGVTLYEMLTGTRPFTASEPLEWVHNHIARIPVPPHERITSVPACVSAIVMKLLAKTPEERYQTASGVESDLRRCLAEFEAHGSIADFSPGQHEAHDRLVIPEKLYGRAREIETLLTAFDRVVAGGRPELVLVSGHSGIGKSAVVNELHKAVLPSRGLFASGKFDQHKREIPYRTIAQAFQGLIPGLISKSDAELEGWRAALSEALGAHGQLVVELVPELKLIIGEQPPAPELPPQQTRRLFQIALRRFVGAFAKPEHPLILFLDDLQWVDVATLDLLEDLVIACDRAHLLVIGAYRDNELDPTHPLIRKLEAIQGAGAEVGQITLTPLSCEHVEAFVADALRCGPTRAAPLAQLVHKKTGGNPFFAIRFLSALADEGLLAFDATAGAWSWDLARISAQRYTENVVDLMVDKLGQLTAETQAALQQLACLGHAAATSMLSTVLATSEDLVHEALWEAVQHDLVEQLDGSYRFIHDRVQEAAYSFIPDGQRAEAHLRIGRLMAARTLPEKQSEAIFEIINQLNRGLGLITSVDEREQLAELNLMAGRRANASTAYASALSYFITGRNLLTDDCWERRRELIFALELHRAECELLTGAVSDAESHLAALSARATDTADRAGVARLRIDLYSTLNQSSRSVAVGLDYLKYLGISWSPHPTDEEARREYQRVWSEVDRRATEELIALPLMTDPVSLATLDVLNRLSSPAQYTDLNLYTLVACQMLSLTLERGNSDASAVAYGRLGMIAGLAFGEYENAYRVGQLAYELVERRGLRRFQAGVYLNFGNVIMPWTRHIRACCELMGHAFDAAQSTGDLVYAGICSGLRVVNLLSVGDALAGAQREAERALAFGQKMQFAPNFEVLGVAIATVRMLRGAAARFGVLDDGLFDEQRVERDFASASTATAGQYWYWVCKLRARFIGGDYAAALDAASRAERLLSLSSTIMAVADYHFYSALSHSAFCDSVPAAQRTANLEAVAAHRRQLASWATTCPENFEDRAALVGAEVARIEGRVLEAEHLYEQAIRSANRNGFIHNEATAYELGARFYAARGFHKFADAYLLEARYCYQRWGADGKVAQLDQLYPHLKKESFISTPTSTILAPTELLDLATVMKVSQAVSGGMVLEPLIDSLMRAAIEHAGAERGLLIRPQGGQLLVEAEAATGGDAVTVHQRDASANAAVLPESVVRYVMRTRHDVILDDATAENPFSADPYILQYRVRSILCLPLINQSNLTGVLYLENNLAARVFTPDRITVLKVLASQAAISLENSRLYRDLEDRERARNRLVAVRADVNLALATDNTLRGILQSCVEAIVKHMGAAFARIWVSTKDGRFLELHASAGMYTHLDGAHRLVPVGHLRIGLIAQDGTPYVTNDVVNDPRLSDRDWARAEGMVAFAGFPLLAGSEVVGVLAMFSREPISQAATETLATVSDTIAQSIQRKQAEEAVRRSEAFLTEAQTLSQTGSWGWNTATGDLFWSRETYRIFGFTPDVAPTLSMILDVIHPDDRARFVHETEMYARDHTDFEHEYRLKVRDGSIKHVYAVGRSAVRGFPDLDFIGAIMDVTERKQAGDVLLKTQAELAEVSRLTTMGELAASIAHEINQPLATVVTNAQTCASLLRAQAPPWGEVENAVADIAEAGKRASDVIARIRALLRKGVAEPSELSMNDVIRDVIALTRETTQSKGVLIDTRLAHDSPRIVADRVQLQQVLINLITNATDAMADINDRPRRLTITSSRTDGTQVDVAVIDVGSGIDPSHRARIFEPFFTTKADGMGMGLAICRGIVEACGGRLWATSNPDFGTTVRFALPAAATEGV